MFAGELPGKQPGRGRVGGGGHIAAVAQVVPGQGGNGLGNVEPVGAELEPDGSISARDLADAQGGDPAGLLAVEHHQAAGDAVFEGEGVVEQQPADRGVPLTIRAPAAKKLIFGPTRANESRLAAPGSWIVGGEVRGDGVRARAGVAIQNCARKRGGSGLMLFHR